MRVSAGASFELEAGAIFVKTKTTVSTELEYSHTWEDSTEDTIG